MSIGITAEDVPQSPLTKSDETSGATARGLVATIVRSPAGLVGLALFTVITLVAVLAPILATHDPNGHAGPELSPPSANHWFGTDEFGRDLFSRVIYGARVSLLVGVLAAALGAVIGVPSGMLAGYYRSWLDTAIMRFWDLFLAFPAILLAIAILTILGPGTFQTAFVLAVGQMPIFARLSRSVVLTERELDYVQAGRVLGLSDRRILFRHIFPNIIPPLLVQLGLAMAFAVLLEAGLSFLGLGTQPPTPSWGEMLDSSRAFLRPAPWYGVVPGIAIALLLLALTFITDAMRNAIDPRFRHTTR